MGIFSADGQDGARFLTLSTALSKGVKQLPGGGARASLSSVMVAVNSLKMEEDLDVLQTNTPIRRGLRTYGSDGLLVLFMSSTKNLKGKRSSVVRLRKSNFSHTTNEMITVNCHLNRG